MKRKFQKIKFYFNVMTCISIALRYDMNFMPQKVYGKTKFKGEVLFKFQMSFNKKPRG